MLKDPDRIYPGQNLGVFRRCNHCADQAASQRLVCLMMVGRGHRQALRLR